MISARVALRQRIARISQTSFSIPPMTRSSRTLLPFALLVLLVSHHAGAVEEAGAGAVHSYAATLFWMAILLLFAKLASLVEKIGQPSVLGELVIGVILGNLALFGFTAFEAAEVDPLLKFLAELGVIILLFQIGLESNIHRMARVGVPAFLVAMVGVVVPFVLGTYIVG